MRVRLISKALCEVAFSLLWTERLHLQSKPSRSAYCTSWIGHLPLNVLFSANIDATAMMSTSFGNAT
eukprot:g9567.t1